MYDDYDFNAELRDDPAYADWSRQLDAAWAVRPEPSDAEVAAMLAAAGYDEVPF